MFSFAAAEQDIKVLLKSNFKLVSSRNCGWNVIWWEIRSSAIGDRNMFWHFHPNIFSPQYGRFSFMKCWSKSEFCYRNVEITSIELKKNTFMPIFVQSQKLLVSDHINLVCLPHVLVPDAQQSVHQFLHHPSVIFFWSFRIRPSTIIASPFNEKHFLLALIIIS